MSEQMWLIEARFKSVGGPWIPQAMEPFMESADAEAKVDQLRQSNTLSEWRTRRYGAEPSPEPEAAPASEAQAPAVPENGLAGTLPPADYRRLSDYWMECTRLAEAEVYALRDELAQLRARVAMLDAQKVKLPDWEPNKDAADEWWERIKDYEGGSVGAKAWYQCALSRERQLLDSQRAVQAQRTIMCDLRNGLVAARDFIDSGDSGWFPQKWRDAIAAYDALAGKGE